MRFMAGLFTGVVLLVAAVFAFWTLHTYSACNASVASGCTYDRTILAISILAIMAAITSMGALLSTRSRH